jgi:hypothetical protein
MTISVSVELRPMPANDDVRRQVDGFPTITEDVMTDSTSDRIYFAVNEALDTPLMIRLPIDDYDEHAFDPDGAYDEHVAKWFDDGVDRQAVKRAVEEFHQVLLTAFAAPGVPDGERQMYVIMSDGRWHLDPIQAYLMKREEPHLTPREWVDRKIQIHARTR